MGGQPNLVPDGIRALDLDLLDPGLEGHGFAVEQVAVGSAGSAARGTDPGRRGWHSLRPTRCGSCVREQRLAMPGNETPATSYGQASLTGAQWSPFMYQIDGIEIPRCGSFASSAPPVVVRPGETTQLFEPMPCMPTSHRPGPVRRAADRVAEAGDARQPVAALVIRRSVCADRRLVSSFSRSRCRALGRARSPGRPSG